jgi:hypothetical protein
MPSLSILSCALSFGGGGLNRDLYKSSCFCLDVVLLESLLNLSLVSTELRCYSTYF